MGVVFSALLSLYVGSSVLTSILNAAAACKHQLSDVEILEIHSLSPHLYSPVMRATRDANGLLLHSHCDLTLNNIDWIKDGRTISWMPDNEKRRTLFASFGIKSNNLQSKRSSILGIEQRTLEGPVWVDSMAVGKRQWVVVLKSAMRRRWPLTLTVGAFLMLYVNSPTARHRIDSFVE